MEQGNNISPFNERTFVLTAQSYYSVIHGDAIIAYCIFLFHTLSSAKR